MRTFRKKSFVLIALVLPRLVAQLPYSSKTVLSLTEVEQVAFVQSTLEMGIPEDRGDALALLIISRSAAVVPLLRLRIEKELSSENPSDLFVAEMSEAIAYAGDEHALQAVESLMTVDEARFRPFISRTLDHSSNWHNPFTIAYRALDSSKGMLTPHALQWCQSALRRDRMQRKWAEAMLDRYGRAPTSLEIRQDPIALGLKGSDRGNLRRSLRLLPEVERAKEQR